MGKILGDDDLNNLSTKIHYSYFDNKIGNCDNVHFYEDTKKRLIQHEGLQNVSDKIMKALCYVYNERKRNNFNRNICNYFYYWLSDMLLTHLTKISSYNSVIGFLYDALAINTKDRLCNILHWSMDEHNFDDIKRMFDYSKDYNTYMTQLTHDNIPCNKDYKKYFQAYVDSYNVLQRECEGIKKSYKYCNDFKNYFSNMNPNLLSTRTCKLVETEEQNEKMNEDRTGDEGKAKLEPILNEGPASEGQPRPSDSYSDGRSTGVGIIASPSNDPPTPITSKSITAVASTAGFLLPSFLMYKFTPAGTWINKLLGRAPNLNHIPLRDSGIIDQFPDSGRFNTENDAFNISYSP